MQGSKLYVGNLSYSVTKERLEELFAGQGEVKQVNIIEGKGFGFVEMSSPAEAQKAKDALNGTDFEGRTMKVDEALPPKSRDSRGGGGGGRDNRGGGFGGRQRSRY
ncbi:MAG: RNA-binding protein [bacterium]|nr:RNA-binding protein [bacterium]